MWFIQKLLTCTQGSAVKHRLCSDMRLVDSEFAEALTKRIHLTHKLRLKLEEIVWSENARNLIAESLSSLSKYPEMIFLSSCKPAKKYKKKLLLKIKYEQIPLKLAQRYEQKKNHFDMPAFLSWYERKQLLHWVVI